MQTILSICSDERLRYTREALLRKIGAEVSSCNLETGLQLARQQRFDLLIVDYSIPMQESIQICEIFRFRWPGSRILQLSSSIHNNKFRTHCDRELDSTEGPDAFLAATRELLRHVEQHKIHVQKFDVGQTATIGAETSTSEPNEN